MEAKPQPPSDPESAADFSIAVQDGDREKLVEAALRFPDASGLDRAVIEAWADMMLEDA